MYLPSAKKSKLPSQVFGVFALEVNEILQATPPKLRREMGMCGNAAIIIYVHQQYYTSTRCPYSSLEPLVPGAAAYLVPGTWYVQAPNRLRRYGGLFPA